MKDEKMLPPVCRCAELPLAGVTLRLGLRLEETAKYLRPGGGRCLIRQLNEGEIPEVRVESRDLPRYPLLCADGDLTAEAESYMLISRCALPLLRQGRALIHGAGFLWQGGAWLLAARSGIGKTTQLRHWQRLGGDRVSVINGDKCILRLDEKGSVWLHASPWTGKEGDNSELSAPLKGVILLRQEKQNRICRLPVSKAVLPIFDQLFLTADTEEEVRLAASLLDALLRNTPVYLLENLGDEASARLTMDTLQEALP